MSIPDFSRNLAPWRGISNIHARFRVSAILPRLKKPQIERKLDFRIGSQWSVLFALRKSQFADVTGLAALLKTEGVISEDAREERQRVSHERARSVRNA